MTNTYQTATSNLSTNFDIPIEIAEFGIIFASVILFFFVTAGISKLFDLKKTKELKKLKELGKFKKVKEPAVPLDLTKGGESIDFLERLIREKYNYYMYLELLPIYLDRKIPEKNIIKEIKEKIYVSVVGSLTNEVKQEILRFFTERGIEIFVHEKIVIMMNETDFSAAERFSEAFREISLTNVSKLI